MNREEIEEWLDRYSVDNYIINDDLTVDVNGNVFLFNKSIGEIPFKFGTIRGYFDCGTNKLTSLDGCPEVVHGSFDCSDNELTLLDNCPKVVHGSFDCRCNKLTSLENSSNILGDIYVDKEIEGFEAYYNEDRECYVVPANAVKAYYLHKKLSQIVPEVTKTTKKVKL